MECLEFKRLALSDPNSKDVNFVEHSKTCPCCIKYIGGVREMDANLVNSLDIQVPKDLMAKLELNQVLEQDKQTVSNFKRYSKVASFALVMFISGFLLKDLLPSNDYVDSYSSHTDAHEVTEGMIVKIVDHMELNPMSPIWGAQQANSTMKTLMASYDPTLKLKDMDRLQFTKICPMDENHDAIHANLETDHGQVTFAYIKGHSVGEVSNTSYRGYLTRIKPVRGGSLVIISHSMYAMEQADEELESSLYWDL